MKAKMLVLTLCAVLLVGTVAGCAMLQKGGDLLCSPTEAQKAEAQAALEFINVTLDFMGQPELKITLQTAVGIFQLVKTGICVTAEQLKAALAAVDQAGTVLTGQEAVRGVLKFERPQPPAMTALRAWGGRR